MLLLPVTVPQGVKAGQVIHVRHPDGSGRLIEARIPEGMTTGSVFYVRSPSQSQYLPTSHSNSTTSSLSDSPSPSHPIGDFSGVSAMPAPNDPPPFSQCLDAPPAHAPKTTKMLKVKVPPGTAPGSKIHVQVPGESRLIAAVVPPNCTEFHVQYQPKQHASYPFSSAPRAPLPSAPQAQKLMLVNVPPGTAAGTLLHVQVPNEPGRLISAKVPPGNVTQFHVSYQPKPSVAQNLGSTPRQSNVNRNSSRNDNHDNWGAAAVPVAGAAIATGVAGAMIYDHFVH